MNTRIRRHEKCNSNGAITTQMEKKQIELLRLKWRKNKWRKIITMR